jgi:hypothetical protein
VLVSIDLENPAFTGADALYALDGLPKQGTVTVGGTITKVQFLNRDDLVQFTGPVTVVGGDGMVVVDSVDVEVDDLVTVQEFNLQEACS